MRSFKGRRFPAGVLFCADSRRVSGVPPSVGADIIRLTISEIIMEEQKIALDNHVIV